MDDFAVRAVAAGAGLALIAGPLGCVMIWRRMAWFGATLAHAALLGVAFALWLEIDLALGVTAISLVVGALLALLQRQKGLSADTLLGVLAHGSLALGLVAVSFLGQGPVDVHEILLGEILAVSGGQMIGIYVAAAVGLVVLVLIWKPLLAVIVHEELARVEGIPVAWVRAVFMVMIAVFIALAMNVVGILLIVSMLIVPAAAARRFSPGPEVMALLAVILGITAVAGGLTAAFKFDLPAGPAIVTASVVLFALSLAVPMGAIRRR
jgi:zinc transport system permease protein